MYLSLKKKLVFETSMLGSLHLPSEMELNTITAEVDYPLSRLKGYLSQV